MPQPSLDSLTDLDDSLLFADTIGMVVSSNNTEVPTQLIVTTPFTDPYYGVEKELVKKAIVVLFQRLHTWTPISFLHKPTFETRLSKQSSPLLLYAVLSNVVDVFENDSHPTCSSEEWFIKVRKYIYSEMDKGEMSLDYLHGLMLLTFYSGRTQKGAYRYIVKRMFFGFCKEY